MITGGGAMHLNDSLGREPRIRYICTHHEQAAAMAAEVLRARHRHYRRAQRDHRARAASTPSMAFSARGPIPSPC